MKRLFVQGLRCTVGLAVALGACSSSSSGGSGGAGGGGGTGGVTDASVDRPATGTGGAGGVDAGGVATLAQVQAILSNVTTPTAGTAPGCLHCHDGVVPGSDGGVPATTLPHVLNFSTAATTYAGLVGAAGTGVDSIRCAAVDGGVGLKRVDPGHADLSALVSKLRAGSGFGGTACDTVGTPVGMPLNFPPPDGGVGTEYQITQAQLNTVVDWINSGAATN